MRWILCGKNDAAVTALEHMLDHGDEVCVVGNHGDDGVDGWQRSLRGAAERRSVAFEQPARVNDPAFVERLRDFGADALISIQYDQILKNPLFENIGAPCLNLHFALLPRHRGVAPIAWALLEGDTEAGVTLHHMVEDIDAGGVIAQRRVPVSPTTTARELYDALSRAAEELFAESYPFGPDLLARRQPQDDSLACYHRSRDLDFSQKRVPWTRPAAELQRWLRAMIFPPMQRPEFEAGGKLLSISRVGGAIEDAAGAEPGTVLRAQTDGLVVCGRDGAIRILEIVDTDGSPVPLDRAFTPGQQLKGSGS